MVPISLEHDVNQFLDRGESRLHLKPHEDSATVEDPEGLFVLVRGRKGDVRIFALAGEGEPYAGTDRMSHDPDGLGPGIYEPGSHGLSYGSPVRRSGVIGGAIYGMPEPRPEEPGLMLIREMGAAACQEDHDEQNEEHGFHEAHVLPQEEKGIKIPGI
jgi:hypothetical protein